MGAISNLDKKLRARALLLALESGGNLAALAGKDFATQITLALIKAKTDNLDVALSTRASQVTLAAQAAPLADIKFHDPLRRSDVGGTVYTALASLIPVPNNDEECIILLDNPSGSSVNAYMLSMVWTVWEATGKIQFILRVDGTDSGGDALGAYDLKGIAEGGNDCDAIENPNLADGANIFQYFPDQNNNPNLILNYKDIPIVLEPNHNLGLIVYQESGAAIEVSCSIVWFEGASY